MGTPRMIGLITHNFDSAFHTPLIEALHTQLRQKGYQLLAIQGTVEQVVATRLATERIDGWLTINNDRYADQLRAFGKPVVLISGKCPGIPCVLPDNQSGIIAAVEHLIIQGRQRIAFLGYFANHDFCERRDTYLATLSGHGLPIDKRLVIDTGSYYIHDAYHVFGNFLRRNIALDAIICANDALAFGVMQAIKEAGLHMPDDIAIIGFDDSAGAQFSLPALSSVRQDPVAIGLVALQMLLDQIERDLQPALVTSLPTQLIVRASSMSILPTKVQSAAEPSQPGDWQSQLALNLVRWLSGSSQLNQAARAEQIWPGIDVLIKSLDAAITGQAIIPVPVAFWSAALANVQLCERRAEIVSMVQAAGMQQIAAMSQPDLQAIDRLVSWLLYCKDALEHQYLKVHLHQAEQDRARYIAEGQLLSKIVASGASPRMIDWLSHSFADWGMLSLWKNQRYGLERSLEIVSIFVRGAGARASTLLVAPEHFPPIELLSEANSNSLDYLIKLTHVAGSERDWGYMAVAERFYRTFNDIMLNRNILLATVLELERSTNELRDLSVRDSLTGLHNRRFLTERFPKMMAHVRESGRPLALAVLDIDNFKQINDTFTHDGGDKVLVQFANVLVENCRTDDELVRLGGEEFALVLPNTPLDAARQICERLRIAIAQQQWEMITLSLRVTISIGLTKAYPTDSLESLLHRADTSLYTAKQAGKNQVVCAESGD